MSDRNGKLSGDSGQPSTQSAAGQRPKRKRIRAATLGWLAALVVALILGFGIGHLGQAPGVTSNFNRLSVDVRTGGERGSLKLRHVKGYDHLFLEIQGVHLGTYSRFQYQFIWEGREIKRIYGILAPQDGVFRLALPADSLRAGEIETRLFGSLGDGRMMELSTFFFTLE